MKTKHYLLPLLILPGLVAAQEIQTDRPDETELPTTIEMSHVQIESGFSFEREGEAKNYGVPELVVRYGVFKNFEFRIEDDLRIADENGKSDFGIDPVVLGIKYHILDHKGLAPDIGLLGRVSIPWLADAAFKENYYSPEIRLLLQHELSKTCHLSYNAGVHWTAENAKEEYIYTCSADHSITKKLKLFVETYGFALPKHHAENTADAGLLFLVSKNFQLDVVMGSGIMHHFSDKFAEIGFSYRI